MRIKSAPAQFKAPDTAAADDAGTFEAIVSVFDNVDSWGDVVVPGAFADTIAAWKASGDAIPVLWSHRMDDPTYNIGEVLDIAELEPGSAELPEWVDPWVKEHGGLWVKGRIDTGLDASPVAVQGLRLLKNRRVTQFSYAYDVEDSGPTTVDGKDANELRKLKLYEVSPTQIGANELTDLLAAKARTVGRKLTVTPDERDRLQSAIAALAEALDGATVEGEDPSADEPTTDEPAADDVSEQDAKRRRQAGRKAGRTLSAKNEANIREAVALLTSTLSSLDSGSDDAEKAKRETLDGAKREGLSIPSYQLLFEIAAAEAKATRN